MKNLFNPSFLLLILLVALSGCVTAPLFRINLNGYAREDAGSLVSPGTAFHILMPSDSKNSLLDAKIDKRISIILEKLGFRKVALEEADWCLRFEYRDATNQGLATYYEPDPWCFHFHSDYWHGRHYWGTGIGYWGREVVYTYTVHLAKLTILVFSGERYRFDGSEDLLWIGEAQSRSKSPDTRSALACMVHLLFRRFLEDTGQGIEEKIRLDDPDLGLLR